MTCGAGAVLPVELTNGRTSNHFRTLTPCPVLLNIKPAYFRKALRLGNSEFGMPSIGPCNSVSRRESLHKIMRIEVVALIERESVVICPEHVCV